MKKWLISIKHSVGFSPVLLVLFSSVTLAEELKKRDVEKIEVIGSHIKKTHVEGSSPVLVITRQDIEMSGYNSLADVLRDLPVASMGGHREAALVVPSSVSSSSIRGMRNENILILMNGRRLPDLGGTSAVDLSPIPLSVIEKVEILKDGASSLYGSDAVGGVINIVTKKDQTGGQVHVQGSLVQRQEGSGLSSFASLFDFWNWNTEEDQNSWNGKGDKVAVSASYGGSKNDINYLLGGQVGFNSALYLADRSFGKPQKTHRIGSSGSYVDGVAGSKEKVFKNCPKENIETDKYGNESCKWDVSSYQQFMPRILQGSLYAYAKKDMDRGGLSAMAFYSWRNSVSVLAPIPFAGFKLPLEVAQKWGLSATKAPVTVNYLPVHETGAGPLRHTLNNHTYQVQLNGEMDIMETMELDGNLSLSGSHYLNTTTGLFSQNKLIEIVQKGEVNWTLPTDQKEDISSAGHKLSQAMHSTLISFEPRLRGTLLETETQVLAFALGAQGAYQSYSSAPDKLSKKLTLPKDKGGEGDRILGGAVSLDGSGDRIFSALYGELSFLSFDMLSAQLSARSDYYYYSEFESSSGFTEQPVPFTEDWTMPVSPRLALSFQPVEQIKLRASYGLGFKAPSLIAIHQNNIRGYARSIDYIRCPPEQFNAKEPSCSKIWHPINITGSTALKPEFSQSFNIGIALEPVEPVSFIVDYFMLKRTNLTGFPLREVLKHEQKYGQEKLTKNDILIERNEVSKKIESIKMPLLNSSDFLSGLDLEINFNMLLAHSWSLGLAIQHIHMLYHDFKAFAGAGNEIRIPYPYWMEMFGLKNDPEPISDTPWHGYPRYRNRATVSLTNKDLENSFELTLHNIPGQRTLPESAKEMDHYWQLDITGSFFLNKQTSLILGIKNIFDTKRPENKEDYGLAGYINPALYSIRGRTIDARLTYNF